MKRFVIFLLLFSLFFSCKESNKEEENKYQVISLLYKKLTKPEELVYPPNFTGKPLTKKDSVRIDSLHEIILKKYKKRKYITAVYPQFVPYKGGPYKYYSNTCKGYERIMDKLMVLKDSSQIDLLKIISRKSDSVIPFSQDLIVRNSMEFKNFDGLFTFSPVSFDKDFSKALIVVTKMKSKVAGSTDLYTLKKEKGKWKIDCEINLGIY